MRPERPKDSGVGLSDMIWEMVLAGWDQEPNQRPRMQSILEQFTKISGESQDPFTTTTIDAVISLPVEKDKREFVEDFSSTVPLPGTIIQPNSNPFNTSSKRDDLEDSSSSGNESLRHSSISTTRRRSVSIKAPERLSLATNTFGGSIGNNWKLPSRHSR
jgi:hypothetical protein